MNYTLKKPRVCELPFNNKTFLLAYLGTVQLLTCLKSFSGEREVTSWKMESIKVDFRALETGRTEYFLYFTQNCL